MRTITIAATALSLTLLCSGPLLAQSGNDLYQQALVKERAEGDVQGAIELYQRIAREFAADRSLAAKALVQMGLCYEKLGLAEARQTYQQVIDGFPEQRGEVAVARERLVILSQALAELESGPTFRKIEIASRPESGVLSPDGSELAFVSDGRVWVVPVQGNAGPDIAGEPLRIATVPGVWDYYSQMAWSADGHWIAVNGGGDAEENLAYVFPARGGDPRTIRLPPRRGHYQSNRLSLSPDGRKMAFSAPDAELDDRLYSILTEGGEPQQMASLPGRMPAFSPDGESVEFVGNQESATDEGGEGTDLWVVPSSGGTPIRLTNRQGKLRGPVWSPDGRFIAVNDEPLGGNPSDEIWVYPLSPEMSSAGEPTKIVLPQSTYHMLAGWTPDGELGVFIKAATRNAIYTVAASGGRAVQVTPEGGSYYPRWSPDGERIYLRWFFGAGDTGRVHDLLTGYETTVYIPAAGGDFVEIPEQSGRGLGPVIPGGGLNISPDGKRIVMFAAELPWDPEEGLDIWTIPVESGSPTRLTSDGSGGPYPCWSPDGQWVAFTRPHESSADESYTAIFMIPAEGGEVRQVTSESDSVGGGAIDFSPDGEGIAFFSGDAIKTIPVQGGRPEVLVDGVQSARHSQLAWSPDGSKIAHDAEGKIWVTRLDGGAPEELRTGLPAGARIGDFSWSPDGEKIAFAGSIGGEPEFWLISDFLPEGR